MKSVTKSTFSILLPLVLLASVVHPQATSVYTSISPSRCQAPRTSEEAESFERLCSGAGGYKIKVLDDDLRQSLTVVTPERKEIELNFWNFYGSFSSVGEKLEWRLKRGSPVALIARYIVSDPENARKKTSYLFVSKLGPEGACVTDIVPPGAGQNAKARHAADTASGRSCKPFEE